ncbi:MAG: hypothetical protein ACM65L_06860 [Microcoleus sp.]
MTNSPVSSLEDIHAALLNQNPFAKPPYLNASDVWGQDFFDVETINAHASYRIFQGITANSQPSILDNFNRHNCSRRNRKNPHY